LGHDCLRIGRLAVERWSAEGTHLKLTASWPLPTNAIQAPACLGQALTELCSDKPSVKLSLVLESAWLPALLADTGAALLSADEVEGLMRHRLSAHHAGQGSDLSAWNVRVDHRAGDRFALGYGLSPEIKQPLLDAAERAGVRLDALTPAFVWGWQRMRPVVKAGWWLWPEQDRLLLARIEAGRVVALNPAVSLVETGTAIERVVQIESARWGWPANNEGVTVGSWKQPAHLPSRSERLTWRSVANAS
jgi:hypothetical protein